jgi:predicted metal-dependent phosphoesterase TrpH
MLKIDLHTHSNSSPDGGITPEEYAEALEKGHLDYIAVTDHNTIEMASHLHGVHGSAIIIGEEISCQEGELIGLFLKQAIKPGHSALTAAEEIARQGGLVYVPHPLETVRQGLPMETLETIAKLVDIVEVHNGRAVFQNRGPQAHTWARLHNKPVAASSDAHGYKGLGTTYSVISGPPNGQNLPDLLLKAHYIVKRPPLRSLFYPKYHRARKKLGRRP